MRKFWKKNYHLSIQNLKPSIATKLGVEIWELLTMLTIVFSIASTILWFNTLQPKYLENQFTYLEFNKHILENRALVLNKYLNFKLPVISKLENKNTCFQDISNSNFVQSPLEFDLNNLKNLQQETQDLQNSLVQNAGNLGEESKFVIFADQINSYAKSINQSLHLQLTDAQTILSLEKDVSQICLNSTKDLPSTLKTFQHNLEQLENTDSIENLDPDKNPSFTPISQWKKTLQSLYDQAAQINELSNNNQLISNVILDNFQATVQKVFESEYSIDLKTDKLQAQSNQVEQALKDFEQWEHEFVSSHKNLTKKIVYIEKN